MPVRKPEPIEADVRRPQSEMDTHHLGVFQSGFQPMQPRKKVSKTDEELIQEEMATLKR